MSLNIKNVKTYQQLLNSKNTLKEELLKISQECARRIKPAIRNSIHDDFLYDERGMPL